MWSKFQIPRFSRLVSGSACRPRAPSGAPRARLVEEATGLRPHFFPLSPRGRVLVHPRAGALPGTTGRCRAMWQGGEDRPRSSVEARKLRLALKFQDNGVMHPAVDRGQESEDHLHFLATLLPQADLGNRTPALWSRAGLWATRRGQPVPALRRKNRKTPSRGVANPNQPK